MNKNIFKIILSAVLMMCSTQLFAQVIDGIHYQIVSSDIVKVVHTSDQDPKYSSEIVIPATITYNNVTYNVVTIDKDAFSYCSDLTSIIIGSNVTTIGENAFEGCDGLASITFLASVSSIGDNAFYCVGGVDGTNPAELIVPDNWENDKLPYDNQTAWYGGYFNSNRYQNLTPLRQNAIDAITAAMGKYADNAYMQELITTEIANINTSSNPTTIIVNRDNAIAKLTVAISSYEVGIEKGRADSLGEMGEKKTSCPAVEVTKGDKTVILYNPDKVEIIKTPNE